MENLRQVLFSFFIFVFLAGCAAFITPDKIEKTGLDKQGIGAVLYKLESISKKAGVLFVRKFVDGKPTVLEMMKLSETV